MARRSDKVVLASHTHTSDKSYDYVEKVKQVMSSPGWATVTTNKLSLEDGGYLFFVLIDEVRATARVCAPRPTRHAQRSPAHAARARRPPALTRPPLHFFPLPTKTKQQGRVYIAITSRSYSSRFIYSEHGAKGILTALQKECTDRFPDATLTAGPNGLSGKLGPILKMLCAEFNDLKSMDKVASVQAKVDAVAVTMKENVSLAMRNTDRCVGSFFSRCRSLPRLPLHTRCRFSHWDAPLPHTHGHTHSNFTRVQH